jgi:preprotein translocase subunit SecF
VEFFRNTNIDFLGKKWYFLAFSLVFSVAGITSMAHRYATTGSPVPLGVDFKGGTIIRVRFTQTPNLSDIRHDMDRAGLKDPKIQSFGPPANNEVLVALEQKETSEQSLDQGKNTIINALEKKDHPGNTDLNNVGSTTIRDFLLHQDPLHEVVDPNTKYQAVAQQIVDYRDRVRGGVLGSIDDLRGHVPDAVVDSLKSEYFTSNFGVRNVDIVGPQVGKQLSNQAILATLYSLGGMLVYLWFRFELIYGIGAVVACFHDTIITVGAFSLLNKDISLTVVAAILTLIGYSMNDTIVVYDRIRENIKLLRRESLADIVNKSINQTLSRTILTSGLTFLTVLSLYIFGGEVLRGFSLALVIGILIGTYSSIAVAAPMLVAYQDWRSRRRGTPALTGPASRKSNDRVKVKA